MKRAPWVIARAIGTLALLAAFGGAAGGCVHAPPTGPVPPTIAHTRADDGWPLALVHYPIPPGVTPRALPVLLCHGLGSNHNSLDLEYGGSLARFLAGEGFDVWALDLRHHGESRTRPKGGEKISAVGFDDYVRHDAPAAVAFVRAQTGAPSVVWVGHSMGGMIGYGHLGRTGDASGVAALVAIASPGSMHEEGLVRFIATAAGVTTILPQVHGRALSRAHAAVFGGWMEWHYDNLVYNRVNLTPLERKLLIGTAVENLTRRESKQFRGWMKHGGFVSADGKDDYAANLAKITVPALLVSGTADRLVPSPNVQFVMERLGSLDKTHRLFGRSQGDAHDWGHVDLIAGKLAAKEVWPEIGAWLLAHDPEARPEHRPETTAGAP